MYSYLSLELYIQGLHYRMAVFLRYKLRVIVLCIVVIVVLCEYRFYGSRI
jgi:hypothetical protein